MPAVIGGKLGTLGADNSVFADPLVSAGYSAVFLEKEGVAGRSRTSSRSAEAPELVA